MKEMCLWCLHRNPRSSWSQHFFISLCTELLKMDFFWCDIRFLSRIILIYVFIRDQVHFLTQVAVFWVFNYRPSHWNKFLYRLLNYKGRRSIFILTLAGTIYTEICSKANLVSSCQIGIKYCESFSNLECYWTFLGDTYSFSGCKIYECYSSLCQSCWHGIIA